METKATKVPKGASEFSRNSCTNCWGSILNNLNASFVKGARTVFEGKEAVAGRHRSIDFVSGFVGSETGDLAGANAILLANAIAKETPLPAPSRGRVSRRVRSFPIAPRVNLRPDEKAQLWLLSISASDRQGLLYSIALVLARHHIEVQLAKIVTLVLPG